MSEQVTPSLLEPAHCVANNLHKTARAVSRLYADVMRPAGLARSQFAILNNLDGAGRLTTSELAGRLYMERTTLTRNLKPLEQAGLVKRTPSQADGRIRHIGITPAGRRKLKRARRYWREAQTQVLARLGEAHWLALESELRALRRLVS